MLSVPDMAVIGALALIFFGPEQLPRMARQFGKVVRDVQNTSQGFIREMERAADDLDAADMVKRYDDRDHTVAEPHGATEPPEQAELFDTHERAEPFVPHERAAATPPEPPAPA